MHNDDLLPVDTAATEEGLYPALAHTAAEVRELDRVLIEERGIPGLTLMKRAAKASVNLINEYWPEAAAIRVYCGSGNNAADGYIVAGLLAEQKLAVEVVMVGDTAKLTADGQSAFNYCENSSASLVKAPTAEFSPDVIVDALLGTGVKGEPRPAFVAAIDEINRSGVSVVALDLPSGLILDEVQVSDAIVQADTTVTFIALKQGLLSGHALAYTGDLYLAPLVPMDEIPELDGNVQLLNMPELRTELPPRHENSHKFSFGHVLVIGGNRGMGGAPLMTGLAAIRSGAGLVSIATHPEHAGHLAGLHPELMIRGVANVDELEPLIASASVLAVGPGLGKDAWGQSLLDAAIASGKPMVLDADGLNLLSNQPIYRDHWILTPHPGEARRLLGQELGNRFHDVQALQNRYGGNVVLKGAGTLVANSYGISICQYGNPGMSTAGMGDVLCGVIAGVLAQSNNLELAAELGVALHSAAADNLVEEFGMRGLMATDLIPEVRRLINNV